MGRPFKVYLPANRVMACASCRAHAADHDDIISKTFQGRFGRAYLVHNVVNITCGPKEERVLMTGLHTVCDINCSCCGTVLGWKYEYAYEESQKYKEGKYILEKARVLTVRPGADRHGADVWILTAREGFKAPQSPELNTN